MQLDGLIGRVKALLVEPKSTWPGLAAEPLTVAQIYQRHVLPLAAIPPLFMFLKGSVLGYGFFFGSTLRVGLGTGVGTMLLGYALSIAAVYLLALVVDNLAPTFGAAKDPVQALKSVAYASTPGWLAGAAVILPVLGAPLVLAGALYSAYLLFLGLPHTMKCASSQAATYAVVCVAVGLVIGLLVGRIAA